MKYQILFAEKDNKIYAIVLKNKSQEFILFFLNYLFTHGYFIRREINLFN